MNIMNFYKYNDALAAGGQPSIAQIEQLKNAGYEAIVNLSPITTPNYVSSENEKVEKLGMKYIHFPVDCSNLESMHFNVFKGIMNGMKGKKVFVHCGGNIKSSNLIHAWHVVENMVEEKQSLETLYKIQQPEQKWFSYFKDLGMNGFQSGNVEE